MPGSCTCSTSRPASGSTHDGQEFTDKNPTEEATMTDFTRRNVVRGGTALATAGALTGPALLDFAKARAQTSQWKPEPGAKLTVMRWKRFVEAEDQAFNAMVEAFKQATKVDMNVFS